MPSDEREITAAVNSAAAMPQAADETMPFSFAVGDDVSAPTRFWRDGRLIVTRTFRSRGALPAVAARLSAQMRGSPTLMTVPGGLLMSGRDHAMWWSVHLQDAGRAGTYGSDSMNSTDGKNSINGINSTHGIHSTHSTHGTIVGSPMRLNADGVTPVAPALPALPRWVPPGGMRVLDTRAVDGTRCHIHQVLTFTAPAASTLGDFYMALDREGWVRQPGSTSTSIHHWQRAGVRLELVVVSRDGGSGAVLHLVAPLPRAPLASAFFAPSRSSFSSELPCKDF
ncbi:hypothetical protein [Pigmentiphaga litoralis]|uniref:Uncharacterized protein n=1 Tax=Pigmentiphaga litoralis TaxID=516702 RepID=A0A7Y9IYS1_9BURK|nr:hypothetical protein [Pigmentiphaga litoralis]NYE26428.1 hypothetical protein [Pigmentiphaga litoralis]NYE85548.1 hypothetical protein [Pigmentiphaga litoralis]